MRLTVALVLVLAVLGVAADDNRPLGERTRQYLTDLVRIDTSNPPGNETKVADYLKQVADAHGIPAELQGGDPKRMNFIARLKGSGKGRPLLLMAHSDVVPAERAQWTSDPFGAQLKDGYIYGRGTQDDKSLLAAELAVMVEMKRRNIKPGRDIILLSEADEEAGSTGMEWLIAHQYPKIDAEFAINEGGRAVEFKDARLFEIQTAEKIPTRVILTAKGTAGHGSMPRNDNAAIHVMEAAIKLAHADQPVTVNPTTRQYLRELSKISQYSWLDPAMRRRLSDPVTAVATGALIKAKDAELDAMLHTTAVPTMLDGGVKINSIPSVAHVQIDVRRMPSETKEEVLNRFKQIVNDPEVEITLAPGQQMPSTEPSSTTSALYIAIQKAIGRMYPKDASVQYMSAGATDGSYLRAKGMGVYGAPIFLREAGDSRAHGNDERISPKSLEDGVELLWQIVLEAAGSGT
jgi:acetylornithine deacetylase/succinyl-diaminopimelate desuccinylase-like protein